MEYQQALRGADRPRRQHAVRGEGGRRCAGPRSGRLKLRQKGASEQQIAAHRAVETRRRSTCCCPARASWVYAQVFEYELGLVRAGQAMTITAPSLPGRTLHCAGRGHRSRSSIPRPARRGCVRSWRRRTASCGRRASSTSRSTCRSVNVSRCRRTPCSTPARGSSSSSCGARASSSRATCELGQRGGGVPRGARGASAGRGGGHLGANFLIDSESRFRAAVRAFEDRRAARPRPPASRGTGTRTDDDRAHHRLQRPEPRPRAPGARRRRSLVALWCIRHIPLDAIPDLSDTQVIVFSRWDRSPDIIEDQVTYPIVTALLGAPKVKAVRGFSDFGFSLRLRHLRGRHRPLLGAHRACSST